MGENDTAETPKTKVKIDMAYLWEKYGNKKKRKPKPEKEEPKYHHEGFSVKFKLSHAYKALEKQEQDVAEPVLEIKKALTPKMIKHLAAKNKSAKPPEIEEPCQNIINRGSLQERVEADLSKFRKIGKVRREKTETLLEIAKEKENEVPPPVIPKKPFTRCKSADFWMSLSARKGTKRDDTMSQDSEYEDRTFLTNANLVGLTKVSKSLNSKGKRVTIQLDVPESPRRAKSSQTHRAEVKIKDKKPTLQVGTKAVMEWDRRRKQRQEKNVDQKCKIHEAANLINYPQSKSTKPGKGSHSPKTSRRKKHRPKSAPSSGPNENKPEGLSLPLYKTLRSERSSKWSKSLDAMYLDVPNNFEEPEKKKPDKEASRSNDSDGEESKSEEKEAEPPRQYKPSDYLYGMCNCQNIAKQTTLGKLQRKAKPAGVIQIFGCPGENENTSTSCPFCSVFPKRRIRAWLDDVEKNTDPFWTSLKLC